MPAGDGTGPLGLGPMTGRAMGYCAGYNVPGYMNPGFGFGFGRGRGFGRGLGLGRGYGFAWRRRIVPYYGIRRWFPLQQQAQTQTAEDTKEAEIKALEEEAEALEEELKAIRKRIEELRKQ